MESRKLKTLQILEVIAENRPVSQRELSDSLQISLGLVNSFIKRLVKKGYCKVTTIPKNRVKYILTPEGAMEKTKLTYEYIASSYHYFKVATSRVQHLYNALQAEGATRVVLYGAGELADIALIAMTGTEICLVGVIDPKRKGEMFSNLIIQEINYLKKTTFDILLVTTMDSHKAILSDIKSLGIPTRKVRFF